MVWYGTSTEDTGSGTVSTQISVKCMYTMYIHYYIDVYDLYIRRQLQSLSVDSVAVSRATTPDPVRPHSGMSMVSECELQTIPSETVSQGNTHIRVYSNTLYWEKWLPIVHLSLSLSLSLSVCVYSALSLYLRYPLPVAITLAHTHNQCHPILTHDTLDVLLVCKVIVHASHMHTLPL